MNGFGKFVRSKGFAALFFLLLLGANGFVYEEVRSACSHLGFHAPGWWLLALMLGILALYEWMRLTPSASAVKKCVLYGGGLYISFFLYLVLSLLAFQILAAVAQWAALWGAWDTVGFGCAVLTAAMIFLYGVINARLVKPVHYTVVTGNGACKSRIVLLSDVHLGMYNGVKHLQKVVDAVNAAQPDLVVIAGDLFDGAQAGAYFDQEAAAAQFCCIRAGSVVMATGNHDPATTSAAFRSFLQRAHIILLSDSGLELGDLVIFGRNDAISVREPDCRRPLCKRIAGYANRHPLIVIDHNPQGIDEAVQCGADLVLCGHTHRGQMFPVNLLTKWAYGAPRFGGHHSWGKTHAVISAGCSVFQLPVRVGTSNEVVAIDLLY